jgi:hypothetical protein
MRRVIVNWIFGGSKRHRGPTAPTPKAEIDNTNPRFAGAFLAVLRSRRPVLLLFSGADRLNGQFRENFEAHHSDELAPFRHLYEVRVIPDANHVLSDPAWVDELLDVAERWLDGRSSILASVPA